MKKQVKKLSFKQTKQIETLTKQFFDTSFSQEGAFCEMSCERVNDKNYQMENLKFTPNYDKLMSKMNDQEKQLFLDNREFLVDLIYLVNKDLLETKQQLSDQIQNDMNELAKQIEKIKGNHGNPNVSKVA